MDVKKLYDRAVGAFGERVHGVPSDAWRWPTTNPGWDVRELVNHLVNECRWAPPLLAGQTVADVGDRFDGDLLGDDPVGVWDSASGEALPAAAAVDLDATVHLSFGDFPASEYMWQLTADHLLHGWDLARATGQSEDFDAELVDGVLGWFKGVEPLYRAAGAIGQAVDVGPDPSPMDELLGRFGRDPSRDGTLAVVLRFNAAFGTGDYDAVASLITEDCVFEDTTPPDGTRHEGRDAVVAAFHALLDSTPAARFTTEEGVIAGDRATYRWRYDWGSGHVRGVDVFRVADGKVAEKLSYVKG
jgi:uncharacterized protein (TIGR03086 family)